MYIAVRMLDKRIGNEKGIALTELVAAILILAVLYLGYASYTTTSFTNSLVAEQDTLALNYAREKLEEMKALKNNPHATQKGTINGKFNYTVETDSFENFPGLYKITVTVNYAPKPKLQKTVCLSTLMYFVGEE